MSGTKSSVWFFLAIYWLFMAIVLIIFEDNLTNALFIMLFGKLSIIIGYLDVISRNRKE